MLRIKKRRLNNSFENLNLSDLKNERQLICQYGLKNKKEIRIAQYMLRQVRSVFRNYLSQSVIYNQVLQKCVNLGLLSQSETVEQLSAQSFLKRRLQTIVSKKFGLKPLQARQVITHGNIVVQGKVKRFPGYLIRVSTEDNILLKKDL